jgi:hypothetical protein
MSSCSQAFMAEICVREVLEEMYLSYSWNHWVFNERLGCDLFLPGLFIAPVKQLLAKNFMSVSQASY